MRQFKIQVFISVFLTVAISTQAQELLTKSDAVAIALENNYDIRAAKNDLNIALNNAKITNSEYLPSISGTADASYSNIDTDVTFQNDSSASISGIETKRYSAGINLDYTLFDGLGRKYSYAKLKENYQLSDLQARGVMENTLVNIFNAYYEIARLTENISNQRESLRISGDRLKRAEYSFEYGQNTQLDVLNAEVDYNTDSINYLNLLQQLYTEKHNLNLFLGREINTQFTVDTTLVFAFDMTLSQITERALDRNVNILQEQGNLRNTTNDIKISNSAMIPKVGVSAGYNWSFSDLGPAGFLAEQTQLGLNLGASLTWNIWDGGLSKTTKQNSIISYKNQQLTLEQTQLDLERNVNNAWTTYQTALFVMEAQNKNLQTNQRNFDRSREQFGLGQVTSLEFRQAQLNLLTAQLNYSEARYSAKIAELALLQLSGDILDADF